MLTRALVGSVLAVAFVGLANTASGVIIADTSTVASHGFGQPVNPTIWRAQAFTTDSQQYTLTEVTAYVSSLNGEQSHLVARLYDSDGTGNVGAVVGDFTVPQFPVDDYAATSFLPVSGTGFSLIPDHKYFFALGVAENPDEGTSFLWDGTSAGDETNPMPPNIPATATYAVLDYTAQTPVWSLTDFGAPTDGSPLRFTAIGVVPEPGSLGAMAAGAALLLRRRRAAQA